MLQFYGLVSAIARMEGGEMSLRLLLRASFGRIYESTHQVGGVRVLLAFFITSQRFSHRLVQSLFLLFNEVVLYGCFVFLSIMSLLLRLKIVLCAISSPLDRIP